MLPMFLIPSKLALHLDQLHFAWKPSLALYEQKLSARFDLLRI